jgi:hypothetical protein
VETLKQALAASTLPAMPDGTPQAHAPELLTEKTALNKLPSVEELEKLGAWTEEDAAALKGVTEELLSDPTTRAHSEPGRRHSAAHVIDGQRQGQGRAGSRTSMNWPNSPALLELKPCVISIVSQKAKPQFGRSRGLWWTGRAICRHCRASFLTTARLSSGRGADGRELVLMRWGMRRRFSR